jgi:bacteriophage CI repressor helix-turn-helix domain
MHSRIFRFIESLQMTQSDFASKTGISPSALTQLKNNAGNLSIDNVIKIKKAFPNISLDWLISGDGEMYEKINDSQSPSLFPDFVDNTVKQEITPPAAYEETRRSVSENDERSIPIPATATTTTEVAKEVKVVEKVVEKIVERTIRKIIVFYDDGKFEELVKE